MFDGRGVTEETWRDAVAALAADPDVARWAGHPVSSWRLMRHYGFTDLDGTRPDRGRWFEEIYEEGIDPSTVDGASYR